MSALKFIVADFKARTEKIAGIKTRNKRLWTLISETRRENV